MDVNECYDMLRTYSIGMWSVAFALIDFNGETM